MSEKSGKSKAALSKAQISREISYDLPINELLVRFENSKSQSPSENTNIFAFEKSFGVSVEALYASKDMRLDHLALQLTANRLGRIAPFFRNRIVDLHRDGIWKLSDHGARQNRDPSEIQYFRDMLLVDAHWILCRRLESQLEPWQRNISIPFYTDYFRLTKGHGQINWYGLKK
ncbi:hypothetical protein, partial [Marinobacter alexandrii]|uniref:hypothetical protein n=1 Tax=Marinobacter alexandrii TaxID=2570351 RepID=UPI00329A6C13